MRFEKKMMKALFDKVRGALTIGMVAIGAILCLMFVVADTVSAATFKTVNGEVVIEAENYTRRAGSIGGSWYTNKSKSGYKGTSYVQSTTSDPKTLSYSYSNSRVEYDINFLQTGTYYLHLRTLATDHTNNGFFATMEGRKFNYGLSSAYFVFVKQGPGLGWYWYTDGGGAERRGLRVSINITKTGVQTLALHRRDKATRIDRIWLTKHVSAPQNAATLNLKDCSLFLSSSSASSSTSSDDTDDSTSSSSGNCTLASKFQTTRMLIGAEYYTDRNYMITNAVPDWMLGRTLIQTPNNEKKNTSSSGYVTFTTPVSWWVYVLFDSRSASVPNWLKSDGWSRYTKYENVQTSLSTQNGFKMYRKLFNAGDCVNLGGNYGPGSSSEYRSNYAVVYGK